MRRLTGFADLYTMYLAKTPSIIKPFTKDLVWNIDTREQVLYLTFDDGPIPEVTEWVLDLLAEYEAKGTFFCIGDNVLKHPEVFARVIKEGHGLGNHTFNHLNGWKVEDASYLENTQRCAEQVKTALFRPPYGRIRRSQVAALKQAYHLIMWDVLSADFDPTITSEKCLKNVVDNAEKGSIVVFHDSIKASNHLYHALPRTLDHFSKLGYRFETLNSVLGPKQKGML